MRVEHCAFPNDLLYDPEGQTWVRPGADPVEVGVTALLANLAGKLTRIRLKPPGMYIPASQSLGSLEGPHYVGPIPNPVTGTIV